MKIIIVIGFYIKTDDIREQILRFIARFIWRSDTVSIKNGHFYGDDSKDYYYFYNGIVTDSENRNLKIDGRKIISPDGVRVVDKLTDDSLKIGESYYLHESSYKGTKKQEKFQEIKKQSGYIILKKLGCGMLKIAVGIYLIASVTNYMSENVGRGTYISEDSRTTIHFRNNKLYLPDNKELIASNSELTFKNDKGDRVGTYNAYGKIILDSEIKELKKYQGTYFMKQK